MKAVLRAYSGECDFTGDYLRVHAFLMRLNRESMTVPNFPWGRWAWMFCLERYLDTEHLDRIGIWEAEGKIAALAVYESEIGEARFCIDPDYFYLKEEMLEYATQNMAKDGRLRILIPDTDRELQRLAKEKGCFPTQESEPVSVLELDRPMQEAPLPEGYSLLSLEDEYDLIKYNRILHYGFNHEGEAPDGEFVSYCGMWHLEGTDEALVEPVATDPRYRKSGLGKAAVLEACRRCRDRGAKAAYVGSSQQFYYKIGFVPYAKETWWTREGGFDK